MESAAALRKRRAEEGLRARFGFEARLPDAAVVPFAEGDSCLVSDSMAAAQEMMDVSILVITKASARDTTDFLELVIALLILVQMLPRRWFAA
jgi:hypothetical protein